VEGTIRYGWRTHDIDAVARHLETALEIEFEPRDSLYLGEYYSWPPFPRSKIVRGELSLQRNFFDEIDQELAYPEHAEHRVLLHASNLPEGWDDRILALPGTEILREPPTAPPI
jgi:hypothetical protein